MLIRIPQNATLARYAILKNGSYAVVTASGKVLGNSFYEIRHLYTAQASIYGAGSWVVLLPIQQATQPTLF